MEAMAMARTLTLVLLSPALLAWPIAVPAQTSFPYKLKNGTNQVLQCTSQSGDKQWSFTLQPSRIWRIRTNAPEAMTSCDPPVKSAQYRMQPKRKYILLRDADGIAIDLVLVAEE
jgi:hypothetical protein